MIELFLLAVFSLAIALYVQARRSARVIRQRHDRMEETPHLPRTLMLQGRLPPRGAAKRDSNARAL